MTDNSHGQFGSLTTRSLTIREQREIRVRQLAISALSKVRAPAKRALQLRKLESDIVDVVEKYDFSDSETFILIDQLVDAPSKNLKLSFRRIKEMIATGASVREVYAAYEVRDCLERYCRVSLDLILRAAEVVPGFNLPEPALIKDGEVYSFNPHVNALEEAQSLLRICRQAFGRHGSGKYDLYELVKICSELKESVGCFGIDEIRIRSGRVWVNSHDISNDDEDLSS